jgi:hypothetical protein
MQRKWSESLTQAYTGQEKKGGVSVNTVEYSQEGFFERKLFKNHRPTSISYTENILYYRPMHFTLTRAYKPTEPHPCAPSLEKIIHDFKKKPDLPIVYRDV